MCVSHSVRACVCLHACAFVRKETGGGGGGRDTKLCERHMDGRKERRSNRDRARRARRRGREIV